MRFKANDILLRMKLKCATINSPKKKTNVITIPQSNTSIAGPVSIKLADTKFRPPPKHVGFDMK